MKPTERDVAGLDPYDDADRALDRIERVAAGMQNADWSIPIEPVAVEKSSDPWKVDVEPRDGSICIYEVPPHTHRGLDTWPLLIAKCVRLSDAELIVSLHDKHRRGEA